MEYIYYSVSFFYYKEKQEEEKTSFVKLIREETAKLFEYYSLEIADIKTMLYDISGRS